MIDNFISLSVIIDRVMRNPGMEDLPYDEAIDSTVDTIKAIANPTFLFEDDEFVTIENNRGLLPSNYVNIRKAVRVDNDGNELSRRGMNVSADPYFMSYNARDIETTLPNQYKIQGEYIYTNFETGKLHIAFDKIPVDFDGTVMVPEKFSIVKAIEFSMMANWFQKKWLAEKISKDKFEWADSQRDWYIGQAANEYMLENIDKRKSISNIVNKLLLNEEYINNDFKNLTTKQYRKNHI